MILVTGGLGFIGSHTVVELLSIGKEVVVVDNLCNSSLSVKDSIEKISNSSFHFEQGDILDIDFLENVLKKYKIDSVIHFASLKSVSESVQKPLLYYEISVCGVLNLLNLCKDFYINKFVFSSSATVYGEPKYLPYDENHPTCAINPYGRTKLIVENMLKDYCFSENFKAICLRYFNPIGAHPSGLIGEDPNGIPNNLLPYINKVVLGEFDFLKIYGDDYDTKDGTGVRDYIHVVDLAKGHVLALNKLDDIKKDSYFDVFNLGTGEPYSVLDVIKTYSKVIGKDINYKVFPRRDGDLSQYYAGIRKSKEELNFSSNYNLFDMCKDSYNFINKKRN